MQKFGSALVVSSLLALLGPLASQSAAVEQRAVQPPPRRPSPPQPSRPGGTDTLDPHAPPAGYLCSTEREIWLQADSCPERISTPSVTSAVRQRVLIRPTLCQYLSYGTVVGHGWSTKRQSAERARLSREFSCGE